MKLSDSPSLFVGVLGLGFIQVVGLYESTAPDLVELRTKPSGDDSARQHLLDADILVGFTTAIVAVSASFVMNSAWPMLWLFGGFIGVSAWHHLILNSPPN